MNRNFLGPFNSTQLTIIVVAAIVAVMPGALIAAQTFQKVVIQDRKTGKKARVDDKNRLTVFDRWDFANERTENFVRFYENSLPDQAPCKAVATPPAGKALVVTTVVVDTRSGSGQVNFDISSSCDGTMAAMQSDTVGAVVVPLQPGFVVPAGQSLWAVKDGSIQARVWGTGYLVPKSWAPASTNFDVSSPVQTDN